MEIVNRHSHLPDNERLSLITGTILLSLALAHFIQLPERLVSLQFPGLFFTAQVGIQQLAAFLIAMLTISGTDWLLRSHPHLESRSLVEHWLLPGVTTWAIGIPLLQLPISVSWWLGFFLGGALLTMVFIAEYIVIDIKDIRRPPAAAGLTAVAFVLYLVLAASLSFADLRLFLFIPPLGLAVFLVSLRTLRLRIPNSWKYMEAGIITLVTMQLAAALHYWPLSPVSFGLIILGPAYALTSLFGNIGEGEPIQRAISEPAVFLAIIWAAAVLIR